MNTAMDAVDWAALGHAYGPAADIPGLIHDLEADDRERAGEALSELIGSIHHQGTVYPATVAAVPFLVEAALRARHQRAHLVTWIGMLADPHHSYGRAFGAVREAVREHAGPLAGLLHDDDDEVRAAVVYVAAQADVLSPADIAPLWHDETLRVAVVLALAIGDPRGHRTIFGEAFDDDRPEVRLAAALALQRAGLPLPQNASDALIAVFEAEADIPYEWHARLEPTTELIVKATGEVRDRLLRRLLEPGSPAADSALWILSVLMRRSRGARELYTPLLGPLLAQPETRKRAFEVLHAAGRAAGRYGDELAASAANYPAVAGSQGFTGEIYAVQALMRLGDPRWVDPACAAARAGERHPVRGHAAVCNAETLAAVQARLDGLPTEPATEADRAELLTLIVQIGWWGQRAAVLVPRLRELVAGYGAEVAMLLAKLGDDDAVVADCLRLSGSDSVTEAVALSRLTGETQPLVAALARRLQFALRPAKPGDGRRYNVARDLRDAVPATFVTGAEAIPVAPWLGPVAGELRAVAAEEAQHVQIRLAAAHLLWAATGETRVPAEVVRDCLARPLLDGADLELARLMDSRDLTGAVRAVLGGDGRREVAAVRTLWAFGVAPQELMPSLRRCLEGGYPAPAREALEIVVAMGRIGEIGFLRGLAERDEAVVTAGAEPEIVWEDEELRDRLRDAVSRLTA